MEEKNLLPLKKFSYSKLNKKLIPYQLRNTQDSYYYLQTICYIQIENMDINKIKEQIGNNNILSKEILVKQQYKYLDDLWKYNNYSIKKKIMDRINNTKSKTQ